MSDYDLKRAGFLGLILNQDSSEFKNATKRFSALAERMPRYIVFPLSDRDVSIAIQFSRQHNLVLAVKGGGNHAGPASSVEDGLVIDMSKIKSVIVNDATSSVTVGGGCLWGDVYSAMRDSERVCIGGGVHLVGVGGHLTGGGWGPLTGKHGLACDNIISAKVVTADGKILCIDQTENQDLFWAIKGGSSQFGIVTEFILRTYPNPGGWFTRMMTFSGTDLSSVVSTVQAILDLGDQWGENKHIYPFMVFARSPNASRSPVVNVILTGIGPSIHYSRVLDLLGQTAKPIFDHQTEFETLADLSHAMDRILLGGPPRVITAGALMTQLWSGMAEELWEKWLQYTQSNADVLESIVALEFHSTLRNNPSGSCFPIQEKKHHSVIVTAQHYNVTSDEQAVVWLKDITKLIQQYQDKNGSFWPLVANGTSFHVDDTAEIWGQNYQNLRKVKAKYDPDCMFNRFFPIQPLHPSST